MPSWAHFRLPWTRDRPGQPGARMWPAIRAALIALAMVVGLVDGLPLPAARQQSSPIMRQVVGALARAQHLALAPFRPLADLTCIRQRWRLFPVAEEDGHRMWVEGRTGPDAAWQLLYRSHDDDHDFLASALEYRRIRGVWNPGTHGPRGGYGAFADWIAGELFARRADLGEIRIRMEKIHIDPRAGEIHGSDEFEHVKTRRRR